MSEQATDTKCANALCGCKSEPGSDYCGPHCAQKRDETDCGCGHAECTAKAFREAAK